MIDEFTKRPWEVSKHLACDVFEEEYGIYPPLGESGPIALVGGEADARLMAAAPDLLVACQKVAETRDKADSWEDFGPDILSIIDEEMAAAIAKATGETDGR